MEKISLKINEIPQQHVGKGRAIIDPKINVVFFILQ